MKLLAIDSNSILNRAYYGVRPLTTKDGIYTNGIYGFLTIFLKICEETAPDAVAFAFDLKAPTFRHKLYTEYKAGRHGMPDELAMQLPYLKDLLEKLGYPVVTCEGYEADDILGTLARLCEDSGNECVIATGDRDSLQLVSDATTVRLATTKMGRPESTFYGVAEIQEKYGVTPRELIQVKALMGDSSDNIPGVAGIGEKTALALISQFHTVDGVYEHLDDPAIKPGVRKKLEAGVESCRMSLTLAEIDRNAPIESDLTRYIPKPRDTAGCSRLMTELEAVQPDEAYGDPRSCRAGSRRRAGARGDKACRRAAALPGFGRDGSPSAGRGDPLPAGPVRKRCHHRPGAQRRRGAAGSAPQGNRPLKGSVPLSTGQRGLLHGIPSCSTATAWQGSTRCPR